MECYSFLQTTILWIPHIIIYKFFKSFMSESIS